jgi:hypothetical protein
MDLPSNRTMTFKQSGFQIVKNFLEPDFVKFIQQYFFLRIKAGHSILGDIQAPNSYSFYSDPLMETILSSSTESLSKISEFNLLPTYSYSRLYGMGDELVIHRDRPSCEISATISLAVPNNDISPIYFSQNEDKSNAIEIILEPGDLCLYRGCDLYHWREPFKQKWYLQSFLHYVNADGEYKDHIYDKRNYLGIQK